jgi:hypothetical protein
MPLRVMLFVIYAMNTPMRSTVSYMRPYYYTGDALLCLAGIRANTALNCMREKRIIIEAVGVVVLTSK